MEQINPFVWVTSAHDKKQLEFRQAVHTVLSAIAISSFLNQRMCMKGGILLSLVYNGERYTADIDFSTSLEVVNFDEDHFISEFQRSLAEAVEKLEYALDCRIQSYEMRPPATAGHNFPTLKIKIGYAYKNDKKHKRLLNNSCPTVLEVDYSFNEPNFEHTEEIKLENGGHVLVYSLVDLIAEKIRAILQQEIRARVRRQDAYDLYCLLSEVGELTEEQKTHILESLLLKANARNLKVDRNSITNQEIEKRSKLEYNQLSAEIDGDLPEFDIVYKKVIDFYIDLPWKK